MIPQKAFEKSVQAVYSKDEAFDSPTPKSDASYDDPFLLEAFESKLELGDGIKGHPEACIFVASLANHTTEETLKTFFSDYGNVIRVNVLRDKADRPYAFVQFQEPAQATYALTSANHTNIDGRKIRVERARVNRTLFVAKLNKNFTHKQLREAASRFGDVESVTIIKNHETNKSKGCGFIKYRFREDAVKALMNLRNIYKNWVIEWATSPNDPELLGVDRTSIFVGGLNTSLVTKKALEEKFSHYGNVQLITLIEKKEDPENKGSFAFIKYETVTSATTAIEQENGTEWLGRAIKVQYCESPEMKEKRKLQNVFYQNYPYYDMNMLQYYQENSYQFPMYYYSYAQQNASTIATMNPKVPQYPYKMNTGYPNTSGYLYQSNGSFPSSGSESPDIAETKSDSDSSVEGPSSVTSTPSMMNYYTNPYMFMNMHMFQQYPYRAYPYPMYSGNANPVSTSSTDSSMIQGTLSPLSSSSTNSSSPTSPIVGKSLQFQGDKMKKTPEHEENGLRAHSEEANRNQPLL